MMQASGEMQMIYLNDGDKTESCFQKKDKKIRMIYPGYRDVDLAKSPVFSGAMTLNFGDKIFVCGGKFVIKATKEERHGRSCYSWEPTQSAMRYAANMSMPRFLGAAFTIDAEHFGLVGGLPSGPKSSMTSIDVYHHRKKGGGGGKFTLHEDVLTLGPEKYTKQTCIASKLDVDQIYVSFSSQKADGNSFFAITKTNLSSQSLEPPKKRFKLGACHLLHHGVLLTAQDKNREIFTLMYSIGEKKWTQLEQISVPYKGKHLNFHYLEWKTKLLLFVQKMKHIFHVNIDSNEVAKHSPIPMRLQITQQRMVFVSKEIVDLVCGT